MKYDSPELETYGSVEGMTNSVKDDGYGMEPVPT